MISLKIRTIAKKCRVVCEQFAWSHDAMPYDYFKSPDLHKMFAVASFFFKRVLEKEGISINCRIVSRDYCSHVFNEFNGIVIDLTATQFDSPKTVHVQRLEDYEEWLDYGKSKICKRICWGSGQSPNKKVVDKLMELYYSEPYRSGQPHSGRTGRGSIYNSAALNVVLHRFVMRDLP